MSSKILVWLTKWKYPFGGGEAFFYQCMRWINEMGYTVYWLSFTNSKNQTHTQFKLTRLSFGNLVDVPGGFNHNNLKVWLRVIKPLLVHHQGHYRYECLKVCHELRIPFISGFHFWSGGIELSPKYGNTDILDHLNKHKVSHELEFVAKNSIVYLASEFMQEVFDKLTPYSFNNIIHPIPDIDDCVADNKGYAVTMINIHKNKGGWYFYKLIQHFTNLDFIAVQTEHNSEELDELIKAELEKRPNSIYMTRVEDVKQIYAKTKICIVGSLVDETYCRVAAEAILNHIPVITTGKGNIKNIVQDAGIYVDDNDLNTWIGALSKLSDPSVYNLYYEKAKVAATTVDANKEKRMFGNLIKKALNTQACVMFLTPWSDQGLGIQSRNYVQILQSQGIKTCIFGLMPYSQKRNQKDPKEWIHPRVYYSSNNREKVDDAELLDFIEKYQVTHCIIPETCWFRVFEIAALLNRYNIRTIAIPNIEIVRSDEVYKHQYFDLILCNNYLCMNKLKERGLSKLKYLGYSLPSNMLSYPIVGGKLNKLDYVKDSIANFVFIGGLNAFTRKNVVKVLQAWSQASTYKAQLTVCIQNITSEQELLIEPYYKLPNVHIITQHLSYHKIRNMYCRSHVVIQVSKQEGLGLGFYESISSGLPCLSLDRAPHNEIIKHKVNGILIPSTDIEMKDNLYGIVSAGDFEVADLAQAFTELNTDRQMLYDLLVTTTKDYNQRFNYDEFKINFAEAILN